MAETTAGREYFEKDAFARELGIELLEVGPGTSRVRLPTSSRRSNGLGTTHGAVIFALADVAFAVACNSHDQRAIGVQANIAYLAAAGDGAIEARATEISRGRKLATYDVRIVDAEERLVAAFQGTAYLR
ncbi:MULTISPECIES: PaaI family thioesterase [Myxococcus]|nr:MULTISPECIES: hotdog fold thioesterase [Myxococcus]NOJ52051.1 hotdog fold thioesterase [Myxococcus xanthus]QPM82857.1 hotdog fold thioesterase [Myxococcus xanthus]QVW65162.1 hotdog fold thioesterase [Myxococcus xanthus DZ2]QZZ51127.1 Acyl-coenzyme A thioesterase PaaI [Myxococcus xanthus]UEO01770.1 hotdog fold thioesterase [Myxococcus xanthus DZ2]